MGNVESTTDLCLKKMVVFSLILVGNKRKIVNTQEEISGREIVEVEFMGEKIKDTLLHKTLLSNSGNQSKVFLCLELGVIPVKYVIMGKRLNFFDGFLAM